MYLTIKPSKESFYKNHQAVAKIDPEALWIQNNNDCFILSKGKIDATSIEVQTEYPVGAQMEFFLRINGIIRSNNKEKFCDFDKVYEKLCNNPAFSIKELAYSKEPIFYMEEKKHYFNPYIVKGILEVNDTPAFKDILENGYGRAKRLGFGLLFVY